MLYPDEVLSPHSALRPPLDRDAECDLKYRPDLFLHEAGRLSRQDGRGDLSRSGAVGLSPRPSRVKKPLRDVETGAVDLVVCEALDRLERDADDVAFLGKKLIYHRVMLHTVSEGHVDEIKFAVAGLPGAIFLRHLIDKTVRGMEAAVLAGRFAGGRAYGFKRVIKLDTRGEIIRGLVEVDEHQASIVERIFAEFSAGASSIQIATRLNADGVPGPRGGQWSASTIRGDPKKATGILNNPLYVGRLVWGAPTVAP